MKGGAGARPGSTHQYINVLLLIQQQPHLLYIAVEDGLDQRRLQRKREASREGGTTWGTREGGDPAASRRQSPTPPWFSQDPTPRTIPPRLLLPEPGPPAAPRVRGSASTRDRFSSQQRLFMGEQTKEPLEKPPRFPGPRSSTDHGPGSPPAEPPAARPRHGLALPARHRKAGPAPAIQSFTHSQKILSLSRLKSPGTRQTRADSESGLPGHG